MPDQDTRGTAGEGCSIEGEMSESEERDIDLIEKYHNGTLLTAEHQAVKDRMASDPVFKSMVEDYSDIIDGVRSAGKEKFKAEVAGWGKEIRAEEQKKSKGIAFLFNKYWQIAAVFLIVALVAVYFLIPRNTNTPEALYASYFVPYEDVMNVRDASNVLLTEAIHFYNNKEYAAASERFQNYVSEKPTDLNAQFYLGLSLIESGKVDDGIDALTLVINGKGLLQEQAEWYRALAYLKAGDIESCKKHLNEINREGHDYQSNAQILLSDL
jgi:TolA-binding protein